ncbi:hypothetical protein ACOMHN_058895 [Nucella lapillus]
MRRLLLLLFLWSAAAMVNASFGPRRNRNRKTRGPVNYREDPPWNTWHRGPHDEDDKLHDIPFHPEGPVNHGEFPWTGRHRGPHDEDDKLRDIPFHREGPVSHGDVPPWAERDNSRPSHRSQWNGKAPDYRDDPHQEPDLVRLPPGIEWWWNDNQLAKQKKRVEGILAQLKFLSEKADALSSVLSFQETQLARFIQFVFQKQKRQLDVQTLLVKKQEDNLTMLEKDLEDRAPYPLKKTNKNDANIDTAERIENMIASQQSVEARQDRELRRINHIIAESKAKLKQVLKNGVALLASRVVRDDTRQKGIKNREVRRMCEVGRVTLKPDDRRIEYPLQKKFPTRPGLFYGLSSFSLTVDTPKEPAPKQKHGPPSKEPQGFGTVVHSYTTPKTLVIEAFDQTIGDAKLESIDVSFQICNIGPGPYSGREWIFG